MPMPDEWVSNRSVADMKQHAFSFVDYHLVHGEQTLVMGEDSLNLKVHLYSSDTGMGHQSFDLIAPREK